MYYNEKNKNKLNELFQKIGYLTGKDVFFIEKDFVQTLILNEIFKYTDKFVFKGGTSLSRVHKVIERFSEDLDISLFFTPSETEKKNIKDFIVGIADNLGLEFDSRIDDTRSKRLVNRYYFLYDSVFDENKGRKQEVLVETSIILKVYPVEEKELGGIVYDFIKTDEGRQYTDLIIPAPKLLVQSLERTLADKVFAICDYYLDKNSERQSRHLFDICKILPHVDYKSDSFNSVVNEVRLERYENYMKSKGLRCKTSAAGISIPDIINNFILDRFFENDYKEKTTTLLYDNTPYDEIIKNGIKKIADWGFPRTPENDKEVEAKITDTLLTNLNTYLSPENVKKKIRTLRDRNSYEKKYLNDDGSFKGIEDSKLSEKVKSNLIYIESYKDNEILSNLSNAKFIGDYGVWEVPVNSLDDQKIADLALNNPCYKILDDVNASKEMSKSEKSNLIKKVESLKNNLNQRHNNERHNNGNNQ